MEGGIVAHEGLGQGEGQQFRQQGHGDAADADEDEAFPEKVLQLGVVAGAVVVADHRGAADGVADENGGEDEADVHDGSVGSHAVLAGQLDELEVIEHVHQGGGEVGQHLRGAVPAGPEEDAALQSGPGQAEKAVVFPGEIDHARLDGQQHIRRIRIILLDFRFQQRPRSDEAHFARKNIEQLRQLVQTRFAQEIAYRRDARIIVDFELRMILALLLLAQLINHLVSIAVHN